jgi:hypothetical protein
MRKYSWKSSQLKLITRVITAKDKRASQGLDWEDNVIVIYATESMLNVTINVPSLIFDYESMTDSP